MFKPLTRLAAVSVLEPGLSCSTHAVEEPGCLVALWAAAIAFCGRLCETSVSAAVVEVVELLLLLLLLGVRSDSARPDEDAVSLELAAACTSWYAH